jgi:hypothetical protein
MDQDDTGDFPADLGEYQEGLELPAINLLGNLFHVPG